MHLKQQILFRADGNSEIGLGHLYRLFALFEMLKKDYSCIFVTKEDSAKHVIPEDYLVELMPLEVKLEDETQWLKNHFQNNAIVIADGYQFKSDYQKSIKDADFKLVYIDDLQEYHMYADLIINHAPGILAENYSAESYTEFAIGLEYALLRPSFLNFDRSNIKKSSKIENIFVAFGGADPEDYTFKTVDAIKALERIITINVVLGGAYKHQKIINLQSDKIRIHRDLSETQLFDLMSKTDLAITTASTVSMELAFMGIPMVLGYFVDNQKRIFHGLINHAPSLPIGNLKRFDFAGLPNIINHFQEHPTQNKIILSKPKINIIRGIRNLNLAIRNVNKEDLDMFNKLQAFFDEKEIPFDILQAYDYLDLNPEISNLNQHISLRYKTDQELIDTLNKVTKIIE